MTNLKAVLEGAKSQSTQSIEIPSHARIGHKCIFEHKNVMSAKSFDPFTHVYMFSIGFPPKLWMHLAGIFNNSQSPYLICFHSPRTVVDEYEFDVELITQTSTSMHGSSEGHTGYLYRRSITKRSTRENPCDPIFQDALDGVG
eukprot:CAMPEP_0116573614 /NCGR_PEP_ID=MMETSP0397-20121206/18890_1 /TAXON_ID=216820 /ORGANISM="Cyclophora tenuis, Strain ECT3854" /LENGTH=142 /DNA_ID=CAMNT_0004102195 /DNA_START=28 /DNA_END=452 /DNA_ORIENTATION=-